MAVDVRSFGVRTPPCTREKPTYGIIGLFHLLPPALAWLWRLVSPRGHDNPSIVDAEGMESEGVGSYWPFATGRRVTQANLLLEQFTQYHTHALHPDARTSTSARGRWASCRSGSPASTWPRRGTARFRPTRSARRAAPLLGYDAAPVARGGAHDRPLVPAGEHAAGSGR